jgi:MFS family permease
MLGFVLYIAADIGLVLKWNYATLLVLRCLQTSGSSGTVALSTAIAADISTFAERGTYIGYGSSVSILGLSISPIIGGMLAQYAGRQWIF